MKWKRTATGVVTVAVLAATAFAVSGSEPTSAIADSTIGAKLPPLPSGPAPSPKPFLSTGTGQTSGVIVTMDGQALYYNDQDVVTIDTCTDTCALVWHPLRPPAGAVASSPSVPVPPAAGSPAPGTGAISVGPDVVGLVSIITRADGTPQVTYGGQALYTYTVDAPGHLTGDGLVDAYDGHAFSWHAATTNGQPLPGASPTQSGLPSPDQSTPGLPIPGDSEPPIPTPTPTPAPHPTVPV